MLRGSNFGLRFFYVPVVTYSSETWTLKEAEKQKLLVFERKVIRRIFGAIRDQDGTWRIRTNEEINRILKNKNIINFIKAQRLGCIGHIHRMDNERVTKKLYKWKPLTSKYIG